MAVVQNSTPEEAVLLTGAGAAKAKAKARACVYLLWGPGFEPRAVSAQNAAITSCTIAVVHRQWGREQG
jgi:hypothetical protein